MAYVYTFWGELEHGESNELLYVGMTTAYNPQTRFTTHNTLEKNGYRGKAIIRYVETPTKADADLLETWLINTEHPKFNRAKNWQELPEMFAPTFDELDWQEWEKGHFEGGSYTGGINHWARAAKARKAVREKAAKK